MLVKFGALHYAEAIEPNVSCTILEASSTERQQYVDGNPITIFRPFHSKGIVEWCTMISFPRVRNGDVFDRPNGMRRLASLNSQDVIVDKCISINQPKPLWGCQPHV
jgi:hypothetical protein